MFSCIHNVLALITFRANLAWPMRYRFTSKPQWEWKISVNSKIYFLYHCLHMLGSPAHFITATEINSNFYTGFHQVDYYHWLSDMLLFCVSIKKNVKNYAIDYIRYSNFRGVNTLKNVIELMKYDMYELRVTWKKKHLDSPLKWKAFNMGNRDIRWNLLVKEGNCKSRINSDDIPKEELRL